MNDNPYMDGVKAFLFMFFAAVVLVVPMTLGAIAFVLSLLGFDIDSVSNTLAVIIWLGASLAFALYGVHDMGKKERNVRR
jgi:succinate dehydrogenase hydrophobic anchor subunit